MRCLFLVSGNVIGTKVYEQGPGCSKCPRAHVCDEATKLCTYDEQGAAPAGFVRRKIAAAIDVARTPSAAAVGAG